MQTLQTNWSTEVSSLLKKYPKWQKMLMSAIDKSKLDTGYCPFVIEIFDQYGLLAGRINKFGCYECARNSNQESQFIAWMFDGDNHNFLCRFTDTSESYTSTIRVNVMSDIFTLNSGDATAMQQHYERIIETLLRTLLNDKHSGENQRQDLKIFDGDRLVYGRENNQFRDEVSGISGQLLNPQLITELQQLRTTPVGDVVEGAINKKVELNGQVILQSDESGKVLVNNFLEAESNHSQSKSEAAKTNSQVYERQDLKQIHESNFLNNGYNTQKSEIKNDKTLPFINGSTRVKDSLQVLEDSPLKNILLSEVEQLRTELKALQQERSFYQELIEQRLRQPKNTSWWQQAINNVSTVVQSLTSAIKLGMREFKEDSVQHKGAASLKTLFHLQTQQASRSIYCR